MFKRNKSKKLARQRKDEEQRREEWASAANHVGQSSPLDKPPLTDKAGHLATEMARVGMFSSFAERSSIVRENVKFFIPTDNSSGQTESSTIGTDSDVHFLQAQLAMSLTAPKNAILSLFADCAMARGYRVTAVSESTLRGSKRKYGVTRLLVLKLGLNEKQERVAIISFSIDTENAPQDQNDNGQAAGGDKNESGTSSSNSDGGSSSSERVAAGDLHDNGDGSSSSSSSSDGGMTVQGAQIYAAMLATDYEEREAHVNSNVSSSMSNERARQLELVVEHYGNGSEYFESLILSLAHQYAAHFCFRNQQRRIQLQ